jgi:pilus assembly protein CpaB
MKPARIAVLAIAIAAAGGSALLARGMVSDRDQPTADAAPRTFDTVDVLVAAKEVTLGQVVGTPDLKWQAWPREAAGAGFVRRDQQPGASEEFKGAIARVSMLSGEPINDVKLVRSDRAGFMSAILPKGMRAISIKISPETGAGGFILPNDRVDVILTRREKDDQELGGRERYLSDTVLSNVRVLAIDQQVAEKDGNKVVVGKTATLELMPDQAESLVLAQSMGDLSLALRSLRDSDAGGGTPISANRFRNGRGGGTVSIVRYGTRSLVAPGN